jgi:hypothetical protein
MKIEEPPRKKVVAVQGDVELPAGHIPLLERRDRLSDTLRQWNAARAQTDQNQPIYPAVLFHDLMRHARDCAPHVVSVQDDAVVHADARVADK